MDIEVPLRLVLVEPPPGVDFGIQRGRGANYETVLVQRTGPTKVGPYARTGCGDIVFDFSLPVSESRRDGQPNFTGPFVQGPPSGRLIYIDVGTYAGQKDCPWSRRMKISLEEITWAMIRKAAKTPGSRLEARIPGTGRDGGPNCATVHLIDGWRVGR